MESHCFLICNHYHWICCPILFSLFHNPLFSTFIKSVFSCASTCIVSPEGTSFTLTTLCFLTYIKMEEIRNKLWNQRIKNPAKYTVMPQRWRDFYCTYREEIHLNPQQSLRWSRWASINFTFEQNSNLNNHLFNYLQIHTAAV